MEIDSLVVSLSLDPRQFNAAQKQSVDQLRKFEQEAKGAAAGVEASTQKMVGGFDRVTKEVLGLGAALLGVNGIKDLIVNTTQFTSALGINAKALGVTTSFLAQWQSAARLAGVDAATTAASISALVTSIANFKLTGQGIRQAFPQLAAIGLDQFKNADDLLRRLNVLFQKPQDEGIVKAISQAIPGSEGLLPLLQLPPAKFNEFLAKAKELTAGIDEQAKSAREVASAWDEAQQSVEKLVRQLLKINETPLKSVAKGIIEIAKGNTVEGIKAIDAPEGGTDVMGHVVTRILQHFNWLNSPAAAVSQTGFIGPPLPPAELIGEGDAPLQRHRRHGKFQGQFEAPHLSLPGTPYGGGATPMGGIGGSSSVDNSRSTVIQHQTIMVQPGEQPATFAQRFNAAIEGQTGSR